MRVLDLPKNKGGRPTKYKKEYCEEAIEYLASGKSVNQLAAKLKVARATIYNWANDNPEFLDALLRGQEYSEAHWETELAKMMMSREVNAPLVKLYFANRFNWTDKQDIAHTSPDGSLGPSRIEIVAPSMDKDSEK